MSKHNRGVSILISGNITYEHFTQIKNKEGTYNDQRESESHCTT